jgi:gliding motility-associated-like protein
MSRDSTLVNIGSSIYVSGSGTTSAPALFINGDYTNRDSITAVKAYTGTIEQNNGDIEIWGNWFNYSRKNVFTNITGVNSEGTVLMNSAANQQYIAGSNATHFEILFLSNSDKYLKTDSNEVNGALKIDAVLNLNKNRFIIDNPSSLAIEYYSQYIKSETQPTDGYGEIQWNIGNANFGSYNIPFGSDLSNTNDLNLQIDIKNPGTGTNGNFVFATYPSDISNNPIPSNTSPLPYDPLSVVDRYWIIQPNFNQNPEIDIEFTYTPEDIKPTFNTLIEPPRLKSIRYHENSGSWEAIPASGQATPALKKVRVSDVESAKLFANWTLTSDEGPFTDLFIPDAFTPNGDGLNDEFLPIPNTDFVVNGFEFYIFDRMGRKIFESKDINNGWNGKIEGDSAPVGVYNYLIILRSEEGGEKHHSGHVTLLK